MGVRGGSSSHLGHLVRLIVVVLVGLAVLAVEVLFVEFDVEVLSMPSRTLAAEPPAMCSKP